MLGWLARFISPLQAPRVNPRARFQNANRTDRKQTADYYTHSTRATSTHFAPNEYAYPIRECFRALLLGCNEPIIFLSLSARSILSEIVQRKKIYKTGAPNFLRRSSGVILPLGGPNNG
jgi:hypothetical protein